MPPKQCCLIQLYFLEFFDSLSSFLLDIVFVLYLSNEFFINDVACGWFYATYGFLVFFYGVIFGCIIDYIGFERALLFGSLLSFLSRLSLSNASNRSTAAVCLILLCPASAALTSPVIKLGVRRHTLKTNQEKSFQMLYLIINSAALLAAFLVNLSRRFFNSQCHITPKGLLCEPLQLTTFPFFNSPIKDFTRVALYISVLTLTLEMFISFSVMVTERQVERQHNFSQALQTSVQESFASVNVWRYAKANSLTLESFASIVLNRWYFICTIAAIGVGSLMRHFGSTFPKYYSREFGYNASYENILLLNPLFLILLMPFFIMFSKWKLFTGNLFSLLLTGTIISSISVFCIAIYNSIVACIVTMLLFTVGEIFWSPKLMELSVTIANEGHEGILIALTTIPKYLSRVIAGITSGYLILLFYPEMKEHHPHLLWGILGMSSLITPLLFYVYRSTLFTKDLLSHFEDHKLMEESRHFNESPETKLFKDT